VSADFPPGEIPATANLIPQCGLLEAGLLA